MYERKSELGVIGRFKYSERRGEQVAGEKQLRKLDYKIFGRIERGCWEGGDNRYIDERNLGMVHKTLKKCQ